jgi:hypothetical protein
MKAAVVLTDELEKEHGGLILESALQVVAGGA